MGNEEGAIPENLMTDFPCDKPGTRSLVAHVLETYVLPDELKAQALAMYGLVELEVAGEEPEEGVELEVVQLPPGVELES